MIVRNSFVFFGEKHVHPSIGNSQNVRKSRKTYINNQGVQVLAAANLELSVLLVLLDLDRLGVLPAGLHEEFLDFVDLLRHVELPAGKISLHGTFCEKRKKTVQESKSRKFPSQILQNGSLRLQNVLTVFTYFLCLFYSEIKRKKSIQQGKFQVKGAEKFRKRKSKWEN